jgi:hypothetical protein
MAKYIFVFSTAHRHFVSLNVENPPLRFSFSDEANVNLTASLFLFGGNSFNVEVESNRSQEDPGRLANQLMHIMSGLWDALGLSVGKPHNLTFEGFINLDNKQSGQLTPALPTFAALIDAAGLSPHDWISLSVSSPQLRAALRDIRLAMETPGEAAVHCYRAIERIRQYFARTVDRKHSWQSLADALNVQRTWLDSYTTNATAVRHGELIELDNPHRDACFEQAASVVIRFAAFIKGGHANLTAPRFQLLS